LAVVLFEASFQRRDNRRETRGSFNHWSVGLLAGGGLGIQSLALAERQVHSVVWAIRSGITSSVRVRIGASSGGLIANEGDFTFCGGIACSTNLLGENLSACSSTAKVNWRSARLLFSPKFNWASCSSSNTRNALEGGWVAEESSIALVRSGARGVLSKSNTDSTLAGYGWVVNAVGISSARISNRGVIGLEFAFLGLGVACPNVSTAEDVRIVGVTTVS